MLVVSDATPLNVLIRMGHAELLHRLFGEVVIPPAVEEELTRTATPATIRDWMGRRPDWIRVASPAVRDAGPMRHRGEREAMQVAIELRADLLLIDDRRARSRAENRGLRCIGTLGILEAAATKGLLDMTDAVSLLPPNFLSRLKPSLIVDALRRDEARRGGGI